MHPDIIESVASEIRTSSGVLSKKDKSYLISDSSNGAGLVLIPLASPEAVSIIQLAFKDVTGETADNASVLEVLDYLYSESHRHKVD